MYKVFPSQDVILRRSRRISSDLVGLKCRLPGSSSKNHVPTYSGRGALLSASSQTLLQEVLRLRLRMTPEKLMAIR